jgi:alkylhydroperoxidase family enzyme
MQAGASEDKVQQVGAWAPSALFDDRERAAFEYAEAMTITGRTVDDALFARIRAHFSEAQTVELTAAVALENFRSKFNVALRIGPQGFGTTCVLPPRP